MGIICQNSFHIFLFIIPILQKHVICWILFAIFAVL